ncbi:MAG TPA: hypothetical protein DCE18_07465 [Syntrophobacteraceae bacterium]|nr:hypothetical protein [Syntrophobacteraceae bacterium]
MNHVEIAFDHYAFHLMDVEGASRMGAAETKMKSAITPVVGGIGALLHGLHQHYQRFLPQPVAIMAPAFRVPRTTAGLAVHGYTMKPALLACNELKAGFIMGPIRG